MSVVSSHRKYFVRIVFSTEKAAGIGKYSRDGNGKEMVKESGKEMTEGK